MSAKLLVKAGHGSGKEYWIEDNVVRVGSDPHCEVCLPDSAIAPHALTVEFRDGKYMVYSRGQQAIYVNGSGLRTHQMSHWKAGVDVQIANRAILCLVVEGNPNPARRPQALLPLITDSGERELEEGQSLHDKQHARAKTSAKSGSRTLVQLVVIIVCVLGVGVGLFLPDPKEKKATQRLSPAQEFQVLVSKLHEKDPESASDPESLLYALQEARKAEVGGEKREAYHRYLLLRDRLLREHKPDSKPRDQASSESQGKQKLTVEEYLLRFVQGRLAAMLRKSSAKN